MQGGETRAAEHLLKILQMAVRRSTKLRLFKGLEKTLRSYILAEDSRRDGRVAEGGGLLNRYRVKSSIGGSNPPLSASESVSPRLGAFLPRNPRIGSEKANSAPGGDSPEKKSHP